MVSSTVLYYAILCPRCVASRLREDCVIASVCHYASAPFLCHCVTAPLQGPPFSLGHYVIMLLWCLLLFCCPCRCVLTPADPYMPLSNEEIVERVNEQVTAWNLLSSVTCLPACRPAICSAALLQCTVAMRCTVYRRNALLQCTVAVVTLCAPLRHCTCR